MELAIRFPNEGARCKAYLTTFFEHKSLIMAVARARKVHFGGKCNSHTVCDYGFTGRHRTRILLGRRNKYNDRQRIIYTEKCCDNGLFYSWRYGKDYLRSQSKRLVLIDNWASNRPAICATHSCRAVFDLRKGKSWRHTQNPCFPQDRFLYDKNFLLNFYYCFWKKVINY